MSLAIHMDILTVDTIKTEEKAVKTVVRQQSLTVKVIPHLFRRIADETDSG